jgi:hypothetical protein
MRSRRPRDAVDLDLVRDDLADVLLQPWNRPIHQ